MEGEGIKRGASPGFESRVCFFSRSSSASRRRWSHPGTDHLLEIWLLTLKLPPPPTHTHTHKFTTRTSVGVHLQRQASEHIGPACLWIFSYLHHLSTSADLTHLFIAAVSSHIRILSPLMKPRCCLRSLSTFYVRAVLGCHLYDEWLASPRSCTVHSWHKVFFSCTLDSFFYISII